MRKVYAFIVSLVAVVSFAIMLTIGLVVYNSEGVRSKTALESVYRKSFYDTLDSVNNLEINLSKLVVSPQESETLPLLTKVSSLSAESSSALSNLPLSYHDIEKTSKYFNQVTDWCASYSKALSENKDTTTFTEQAEILYSFSKKLNLNLQKLYEKSNNGMLFSLQEGVLMPKDFSLDLGESGENAIEYPTLIYDGPFSDAKKFTWTALEGKEDIDESGAKSIASKIGLENIKVLGVTEGKTTLYQLSGEKEGDTAYLSVTKKGGYIVNYDLSLFPGGATLSQSQAIEIAKQKAGEMGYEGLEAIWYNTVDGVGFVNLAPKINGAVCYPDIVKVKIALSDGALLGLEASGYCSSHKDRTICPTITESTALSLVSSKIAVKNIGLAVIPYGEGNEKLCYEVNGEYNGLDYFVYIDAYDGKTRDILRVVNNDQGSLVM